MPLFRCWADLPPDLLCCIGNRLGLKWYASARGTCTAWRRALAPPSPALLVATDYYQWLSYAASLPLRRSFRLAAMLSGVRCVGAGNGWLAMSVPLFGGETVFVLVNPVTRAEVALPPLIHERRYRVSKIVFGPCPTKDDFVVAAICDTNRIAYVTAGARRWAVMDPIRLALADQLTDIVYTDDGKVYCLTTYGDVHLLRLPERRRREPASNDKEGPSEPEFSVLQRPPVEIKAGMRTYDIIRPRSDSVVHEVPWLKTAYRTGPHMNAPATIEPLLSEAGGLPFNPATVFAPPYDKVSVFARAKNLVLCEGSLYQVWRNTCCTVTLNLPGGGKHCLLENEVAVLRYGPHRQPCWDVVKDLGGYSFFVGCNNAVAMHAEGVPGLRGNCVYWIGGSGRDQGMTFDMATGQSAPPCKVPELFEPRHIQKAIWYFFQ